ncbi:uncharacterized protein N7459_004924 [Penicillium hispanicum]|uniref:uncharacterized protein n=1 Tax=Penicillium hispanicum TaxID=1080232 RepID=UPI00253FA3E5|nr:uncharacterized protein N7459_004924 [Penicillium hispanicum]KAJ5585124.1 hypothetical protein N7459_004924 [Penicillium hispanicum]
MNGPRPSTRAFLYDLPSLPSDTKIRFLGCVQQYNVNAGHLILEHNYPRSRADPSTVAVDINAILEDVTSEQLRVGSWLNVLGYVRDSTVPTSSFSSTQQSSQESSQTPAATIFTKVSPRPVYVEAIMAFPAGAIELGEYERILRNAQDVERRMHLTG